MVCRGAAKHEVGAVCKLLEDLGQRFPGEKEVERDPVEWGMGCLVGSTSLSEMIHVIKTLQKKKKYIYISIFMVFLDYISFSRLQLA